MTFDPADHHGAPSEAPHAPGALPRICRSCGGDAWYFPDPESLDGDPVTCGRCGGSGQEPYISSEVIWGLIVAFCVGFWVLIGARLFYLVTFS